MLHEKSVSEMKGALSAIFTPFDSSNEINFDALSSIAEYQLQHGLNGFYATGTTGEGLLLSSKERTSVIRHLVDCFGDRATVVAHVGHPSTDVAVSLARAAAGAGADWISSVAPIYYGTTYEGLVRHYSAISNATDLPFMAYSLGGVIDPVRDADLFELKNICALKYTGANFFSVQQLRRRIERPVAMMSGFERMRVNPTHFNNDPTRGSRPFNRDREGFVLAEGSWMMILEELEHANSRGALIYGEVLGYGSTCDAYHRVAIMPDGKQSTRAMRLALKDAKINKEQKS